MLRALVACACLAATAGLSAATGSVWDRPRVDHLDDRVPSSEWPPPTASRLVRDAAAPSNVHLRCTVLSVLLAAVGTGCYSGAIPARSSFTFLTGHLRAELLAAVGLLYVAEALSSSTWRYVSGVRLAPGDVSAHLHEARVAVPSVRWMSRSFHYMTYPVSDRKGRVRYERRKVFTHHASYEYRALWHQDATDLAAWAAASFDPMVKVSCATALSFSDADARAEYEAERDRFRAQNHVDAYQQFTATLVIPGLRERMLCIRGLGGHGAVRPAAFLAAVALVGPNVVYRRWLEKSCTRVRVVVHKVMGGRADAADFPRPVGYWRGGRPAPAAYDPGLPAMLGLGAAAVDD